METKIHSSSGFSHKCSVEELYVLTRHWFSDIIFFEKELNHFRSIFHRFILPQAQKLKSHNIHETLASIKTLYQQKEHLKRNIIAHQNQLSAILDHNNTSVDFNAEQSRLECAIFDFIKAFRAIKLELFDATEHIQQNALLK